MNPRRISAPLRADMASVARDPMMAFATVLALVPTLALALTSDAMDEAAITFFGLSNLSAILGTLAVTLPAFLIGWTVGFLLIEDRDQGVLVAVQATPLGRMGYFSYRLLLAAGLAFGLSLTAAATLMGDLGPLLWSAVALICALTAASVALLLAALARNKVEGLALTKLINFGLLTPLLALLPAPWRWAGGMMPPYWIGEMAGLSEDALPPGMAGLAGLLLAAGFLWLTFSIASRRLG